MCHDNSHTPETFRTSISQLQFNLSRILHRCTTTQEIALITCRGEPTHRIVPIPKSATGAELCHFCSEKYQSEQVGEDDAPCR